MKINLLSKYEIINTNLKLVLIILSKSITNKINYTIWK